MTPSDRRLGRQGKRRQLAMQARLGGQDVAWDKRLQLWIAFSEDNSQVLFFKSLKIFPKMDAAALEPALRAYRQFVKMLNIVVSEYL